MLTRFVVFPFFILGLFLLQSCAESGINDSEKRNENWCWFVDKNTGEGKWVPVGDQTTLPDGAYTLFFSNGGIRQTGKLKDQKDCDTIFYYDLAGKVISKLLKLPDSTLKEFMPDGKYTSYFPTCEISGKGEFKNNKVVGSRYEYYRNGKQKFRSDFINDSTKTIVTFFETGQIEDSIRIVNDKRDGFAFKWHENGQIAVKGFHKNDIETGPFIFYYPNGKMEQKGTYKNGVPDDTITDWYENGQIKFKRFHLNGNPEGPAISWHENGKVEIKINYKNGNAHGLCEKFNDRGILVVTGYMENGDKKGTWKYYDDNGKLIETKQH